MGLDLERATHLVDQAIELADGKGDQMPQLLCVRGTCLVQAGALAEASHVLEWARTAAVSLGDTEALADTMFQQIEAAYFRGDGPGMQTRRRPQRSSGSNVSPPRRRSRG